MAIQVRCPKCRRRNAISNSFCSNKECQFAIGKFSNKDYWIDYRINGQRKWEHIGKGLKKAAENRLREVQTQILEGRYINTNKNWKKNLQQLVDWYLDLREVRNLKSYKTLKKRIQTITSIIGENKKIIDLTRQDADRYFDQRSKDRSRWSKNNTITKATLHKEFSALNAMLNKALAFEQIEKNPFEKIPNIRIDNTRKRIVSEEEFKSLIKESPEYLKGVIMMGYYLPMRKKQITGLCWDEVDLKENLIRLEPTRNKGGHDFQVIPIHPEVKRMLINLSHSNSSGRVFLKMKRNSTELIPFDDFQTDWRRLVEQLDLGDLVFHDLRHSAITNLRKSGNATTVIMKASGCNRAQAIPRCELM